MNPTLDHDALRAAWTTEMNAARAARRPATAARSGITSSAPTSSASHSRAVTSNPSRDAAIRARGTDLRESVGQLFRILVAAPGSWTGRYPAGNTGGANVSAFEPMPLPDDLRDLLAPPPRSRQRRRARLADVVSGTLQPGRWRSPTTAEVSISGHHRHHKARNHDHDVHRHRDDLQSLRLGRH